MKKGVVFLGSVLLLLVLGLGFSHLGGHSVSLFLLRGSKINLEAYKLDIFLNDTVPAVSSLPLTPDQLRTGGDIMERQDINQLVRFSKNFGTFSAVIGFSSSEDSWPGYLGGWWQGFSDKENGDFFDNLQWSDRLYLAFHTKVPPPAPLNSAVTTISTASVLGSPTPVSQVQAIVTPVAHAGPVRVEILNGCGITNAADWVARRLKGPGIAIVGTGNADQFRYAKTILRTSGGIPLALEEAMDRLGLSKDSVEETSSQNPGVDVVVVVGRDYSKLREHRRDRNHH